MLTNYFRAKFSKDKSIPRKGRRSLTSNVSYGTITNVQSSCYPDEGEQIKVFFLLAAAHGGLGATTAAPSQTIVIRHTIEDSKEVEAE